MKTMKIMTALFIALVAMSSCSSDDNNDTKKFTLSDIEGEWYAETPTAGVTYDMRTDDELQEVAYDRIGIKLSLKDGIGEWTHYYIANGEMVNYEGGYDNLFGYTADNAGTIVFAALAEGNDITLAEGLSLRYSDGHIVAQGSAMNLVFSHPDSDQATKLAQWDADIDADHMGYANDETGTDLDPNNANEPSRVRQR